MTKRDETNNFPENCPYFPPGLLLDLQNVMKEIKANSSLQIQPNLASNCELTKLQEEHSALKQSLRDVEDRYDFFLKKRFKKREASSIQDESKSLMTALRIFNNEIGKDSKYRGKGGSVTEWLGSQI